MAEHNADETTFLTRNSKVRRYGTTLKVSDSSPPQYCIYHVEPTDTLQGIALKFDTTVSELKRINKLWNDSIILKTYIKVPDQSLPGTSMSQHENTVPKLSDIDTRPIAEPETVKDMLSRIDDVIKTTAKSGSSMTSSSRASSDDGGQLLEVAELISESWYWPGASKNEIGKALEGKPNGTFVIRDASSPGDYTLTVRARGETKLVKINVMGGLCGFNPQSLDFRSIQELVDCHRKISLKTYNANLDTMLLFPLRDSKRRQSGDEEFDRFLAIERFRTMKCAFMRATKLYDIHHGEQIRADNLLRVEKAALADVHKKVKLLEEVVVTQKGVITDLPQENLKLHVAFKGNAEVLSSALSTLRLEAATIEAQKARLESFIADHKRDLERESENVQVLSSQLEKQMQEMRGTKSAGGTQHAIISETKMQEISEQVEYMRQQFEPLTVSCILNDLPLKWDPARFLVNDPSKEAAGALIEAARARLHAEWLVREESRLRRRDSHSSTTSSPSSPSFPFFDGVFLIRPSASQQGRLVLSILYGGRISHCLIEEAPHGWGFENGGLSFVSIGDFVRYYAVNSLEEHNKQIRTVLTEPVLP